MSVEELALRGARLWRGTRSEDRRGHFDRLLDPGVVADLVGDLGSAYVATAHNPRAGTVRGLHWQVEPFPERKTLWCHRGALLDVLVDVRREEPTFGRWVAVELSAEAPAVLHVPAGVAHGYQTTAADTGVTYLLEGRYSPDHARTLSFRDPHLAIPWPLEVTEVSDADAGAPGWDSLG